MNKQHADVVIIGGGIIGAAIAYYSAKAGIAVTVLEKN
ncbi:MAG TPA: FAD-dependent oxidoreductase, partial [Savagea sp.]